MTPPPEIGPDETAALRRQLILSQVQLMEAEDKRDALATELAATHDLLAQTRALADSILATQTRLESENRQLREELDATSAAKMAVSAELTSSREHAKQLAQDLDRLGKSLGECAQTLQAAESLAAERASRIEQLGAERRAMKASRSWRYTAPLRSLERALQRGEKNR